MQVHLSSIRSIESEKKRRKRKKAGTSKKKKKPRDCEWRSATHDTFNITQLHIHTLKREREEKNPPTPPQKK
jgi:hypothetical protein